MLVVSDTSPILNLAAVGRADLLGSLYGELVIPPAVQGELASLPRRFPRFAAAAPPPSFLRVEPIPGDVDAGALLAELALPLDPGEAEALALAASLPADLLLVDEFAARRLARIGAWSGQSDSPAAIWAEVGREKFIVWWLHQDGRLGFGSALFPDACFSGQRLQEG